MAETKEYQVFLQKCCLIILIFFGISCIPPHNSDKASKVNSYFGRSVAGMGFQRRAGELPLAALAKVMLRVGVSCHSNSPRAKPSCCAAYRGRQCADSVICKVSRTVHCCRSLPSQCCGAARHCSHSCRAQHFGGPNVDQRAKRPDALNNPMSACH